MKIYENSKSILYFATSIWVFKYLEITNGSNNNSTIQS